MIAGQPRCIEYTETLFTTSDDTLSLILLINDMFDAPGLYTVRLNMEESPWIIMDSSITVDCPAGSEPINWTLNIVRSVLPPVL